RHTGQDDATEEVASLHCLIHPSWYPCPQGVNTSTPSSQHIGHSSAGMVVVDSPSPPPPPPIRCSTKLRTWSFSNNCLASSSKFASPCFPASRMASLAFLLNNV